jgi:hypothetical protein
MRQLVDQQRRGELREGAAKLGDRLAGPEAPEIGLNRRAIPGRYRRMPRSRQVGRERGWRRGLSVTTGEAD